jgi:hypothetical protein
MSRISSFKREWDEDKAVSSVKDEEIISSTIASAASQTSTNGTASRPSGKSRFATIMAALQASDGNKATGKMTPSPVQPTMSMSQESTAAWVNSVSGSSGTQNTANSGGSSKRTRDSTEEDEEAAKKQRSSREKAKAGMQTNLTVMEKAVTGSATGSEKLVITLSYEQSQILELVKKGSNIFFTGSAGKLVAIRLELCRML